MDLKSHAFTVRLTFQSVHTLSRNTFLTLRSRDNFSNNILYAVYELSRHSDMLYNRPTVCITPVDTPLSTDCRLEVLQTVVYLRLGVLWTSKQRNTTGVVPPDAPRMKKHLLAGTRAQTTRISCLNVIHLYILIT